VPAFSTPAAAENKMNKGFQGLISVARAR
jgi:hypothetical protein